MIPALLWSLFLFASDVPFVPALLLALNAAALHDLVFAVVPPPPLTEDNLVTRPAQGWEKEI